MALKYKLTAFPSLQTTLTSETDASKCLSLLGSWTETLTRHSSVWLSCLPRLTSTSHKISPTSSRWSRLTRRTIWEIKASSMRDHTLLVDWRHMLAVLKRLETIFSSASMQLKCLRQLSHCHCWLMRSGRWLRSPPTYSVKRTWRSQSTAQKPSKT